MFIISGKMWEELLDDAITNVGIENVSHNEIRRYLCVGDGPEGEEVVMDTISDEAPMTKLENTSVTRQEWLWS